MPDVAYAVRLGLRSGVFRAWTGPDDASDLPLTEPADTPPPEPTVQSVAVTFSLL